MDKKELISQIYKILLLYEDAINEYSTITENAYLGYLDRIYIYWVCIGDEEIFYILKGLRSLGLSVEHHIVRSMIFHIISLIEKGGVCCGV